jgi:hypothetical protein
VCLVIDMVGRFLTCVCLITVVVALLASTRTARASANDGCPDTFNRYQNMKYGLFVHYVPNLTVNSDGVPCKDIDELADSFDAEGFADDLASMGVEYVVFTAWHSQMVTLYPSTVMERWRPGHSSKRDLIGDMIDAVRARGIEVFLYTQPRDGHEFRYSDRIATGWGIGKNKDPNNSWDPNWATFEYDKWNDFTNEIYAELMDRYGDRIMGLFMDEGSPNGDSYRVIDYPRLRQTIKSRNPDVLMMQNFYGTNYSCDIGMKEYGPGWGEFRSSDGSRWPSYNIPVTVIFASNWYATQATGTYVVRFSAEDMFRYTVLQAGTNRIGGGVAWAAGNYWGGGWETNVLKTMQTVGNYIAPIARSIKGTFPSTSYCTNSGTTIADLQWGVATRSIDDRYEYIHVLNPPKDSNELRLPAPEDGKLFGSASLVSNGHAVGLSQTPDGVTLTLLAPDGWDRLDTVIQLEVIGYSHDLALGCSVTASSYVGDASCLRSLTDGVNSSVPGSMGWSSESHSDADHTEWVAIDLGEVCSVGEVDLYPMNSLGYVCTGFPVDFVIETSVDNVEWTTVVKREGYQQPLNTPQKFAFDTVSARYVRVRGTKLRRDPGADPEAYSSGDPDANPDANLGAEGRYRMQFAEIKVYPTSVPFSGATVVNDTDPTMIYEGNWQYSRWERNHGDYEGDMHMADTDGSYFEFVFTGTGIEYIANKSLDHGTSDIYIDGSFQGSVNAWAKTYQAQEVLFRKEGLPHGKHTLKVVKTGGQWLQVDALRILQ